MGTSLPLWAIEIISVFIVANSIILIQYKTRFAMKKRFAFLLLLVIGIAIWFVPINSFFQVVVCWSCAVLIGYIIYKSISGIDIDNDGCMTQDHSNGGKQLDQHKTVQMNENILDDDIDWPRVRS